MAFIKAARLHLSIMVTVLVSPGHLHFCTESLRLFCSTKLVGEWAESFFHLVFIPTENEAGGCSLQSRNTAVLTILERFLLCTTGIKRRSNFAE